MMLLHIIYVRSGHNMLIKKAIDTNVLVRLLVDDNPKQSQCVYELMQSCYEQKNTLFVSSLVILELMWVLLSCYDFSRDEVIEAITNILNLSILEIEYQATIQRCLQLAKGNTYDLSDLLIGCVAQNNQCDITLTFDKKASKSELFQLLNTNL